MTAILGMPNNFNPSISVFENGSTSAAKTRPVKEESFIHNLLWFSCKNIKSKVSVLKAYLFHERNRLRHVIYCVTLSKLDTFVSVVPFTDKEGYCPAPPNGTVGICGEFCTNDQDCTGNYKCCSNGCGHTCVPPLPVGKNFEFKSPRTLYS